MFPRCGKLTTGGDLSDYTCVLNHGLEDIEVAGFTAVNDMFEANDFYVLKTLVEDTGTVTFAPACGKFPTSVRSEFIEHAAQPCHLEQCDILSHDMGPSLPVLACRCPAFAKSTGGVVVQLVYCKHVIVSFYV